MSLSPVKKICDVIILLLHYMPLAGIVQKYYIKGKLGDSFPKNMHISGLRQYLL